MASNRPPSPPSPPSPTTAIPAACNRRPPPIHTARSDAPVQSMWRAMYADSEGEEGAEPPTPFWTAAEEEGLPLRRPSLPVAVGGGQEALPRVARTWQHARHPNAVQVDAYTSIPI